MDFQPNLWFLLLQYSTHGWVLDLGRVVDEFYRAVDDPVLMLEKRRQLTYRNITIFVNGEPTNLASMTPIPGRIIGNATE